MRKKRLEKKTLQLQKCKGCSIKFIPKDRRHRFHSVQCRVKYYEEHYYSPEVTKVCANPECGRQFPTSMPKKQDYCCPECREQARQLRQDEVTSRVRAERRTYLGERFAALQKSNFTCEYCRKSRDQGAILDVVDDNGELKAACLECRVGKEFLGTNQKL